MSGALRKLAAEMRIDQGEKAKILADLTRAYAEQARLAAQNVALCLELVRSKQEIIELLGKLEGKP